MAGEVRTAEELKMEEYNYFIAFSIDVDETNVGKIEHRIKTKGNDASGQVISRRLNELRTDILAIMIDDAVYENGTYRKNAGGRAAEAKRAKDMKLAEAREAINLICATKKNIMQSEIQEVINNINKTVKFFDEKDVDPIIREIKGLGIKFINNVDKKIPFSDYRDVETNLKVLNPPKANLYEFLEIPQNSNATAIQAAFDAKQTEASNEKNLLKAQAMRGLCQKTKRLLIKPDDKKQYDYYLLLKDDVWDKFELMKKINVRRMENADFENFLEIIMRKLKVSIDEASEILGIGCKYYVIQVGADSTDVKYMECPFCKKLIEKKAEVCKHCGKSLVELCWNCGEKKGAGQSSSACSHCGATDHTKTIFDKSCADFDKENNTGSGNINALRSILIAMKGIVPTYVKLPKSYVAKKIAAYEVDLKKKEDEEARVGSKYRDDVDKIRKLMAQKKYVEASRGARALNTKYPGYDASNTQLLISSINKFIDSAKAEVALARGYIARANTDAAIQSAVKALNVCADYSEAQQILNGYPPKPVSNVSVSVVGDKVKVTWQVPVREANTTFTVIKRNGSAPTSAEDGAVVDQGMTINFFEDANVVPATAYYYAVYVERYGVKSPIAKGMVPVVVYPDVSNVAQQNVNDSIKIGWDTPQNVASVEVWRKAGAIAPLRAGDGEQIKCESLNGFHDLKAKTQTSYLIICHYKNNGKDYASRGIKQTFTPFKKTSPLENVSIKSAGDNKFVFTCDEYDGKIKIYYSEVKIPVAINKPLRFLDFAKEITSKGAKEAPLSTNAEGNIVFALPADKLYQVYPILINDQLFVVSKPELINTVAGFKCRPTFSQGILSLEGALHPKAKGIVVKINHDEQVYTMDAPGENKEFSREDATNNNINVQLTTNTMNYISIFTLFEQDGVRSYSQPTIIDPIDYRETVKVTFVMDYEISNTKPFKVNIQFSADQEVDLPNLILVKGNPRPRKPSLGELCATIEGFKLKKGLFSKKYTGKVSVKVDPTSRSMKFKLFEESDISYLQLSEVKTLLK